MRKVTRAFSPILAMVPMIYLAAKTHFLLRYADDNVSASPAATLR
jgi:hypothetical protein